MSLPINLNISKKLQLCRSLSRKLLLTITLVLILLPGTEIFAQGNLLITPRRVVFEGSKRSMDLNLANTGQDTATYAISIVQIRMKDDGGFETITEPDPGQRFADRFVRFFPRQVTLPPNEAQAIKIQLVRSNELTAGEYRSHFYFRAVPKVTALGEEEAVSDTAAISVKLTPIFGITIPIIIRSGVSSTEASITDLAFNMVNDTLPSLKLTFNRTGNMSIYGDLIINHISTQGKITRVGSANGVAVYTPNLIRRFQVILNFLPGVDYKSGKLQVTYTGSSDAKPIKYAENELVLR